MRSPHPATAAAIMLAALAGPGTLTGWWSWTGLPLSQASGVLVLAHVLKLSALAGLFAWCNRTRPVIATGGMVAAVLVTAVAVLVPGTITYALYYLMASVICLVPAVQYLGAAQLWPPQLRDAAPLLIPFPIIFAGSALAAAIIGISEPRMDTLPGLAAVDGRWQAAVRSVFSGVAEEAAAALLITGLTRRRTHPVLVYGVCALTRVAYHPQYGWGSVGLVIVALGMTALYRHYGRVLPLMVAHAGADVLRSGGHLYLLALLVVAGTVHVIVRAVMRAWWWAADLRRPGADQRPAPGEPDAVTGARAHLCPQPDPDEHARDHPAGSGADVEPGGPRGT